MKKIILFTVSLDLQALLILLNHSKVKQSPMITPPHQHTHTSTNCLSEHTDTLLSSFDVQTYNKSNYPSPRHTSWRATIRFSRYVPREQLALLTATKTNAPIKRQKNPKQTGSEQNTVMSQAVDNHYHITTYSVKMAGSERQMLQSFHYLHVKSAQKGFIPCKIKLLAPFMEIKRCMQK